MTNEATKYIARSLERVLSRAASEFPAIVLSGPRQAGKTTILRALFGGTHHYVSLEAPDVRSSAEADPRGFLAFHQPPVIFDEIQLAPMLLPYIKDAIDADRNAKGRYILTGSQNLMLINQVTETLAGRAAVLNLLPLSRREISGHPDLAFPWERQALASVDPGYALKGLWERLLAGFYPETTAHPSRDISLWQSSYIRTYLERDIRTLRQVGDLSLFQSFLRAIAARTGTLLNLADVSRDLGMSLNTARQWLSLLEATWQVFVLRPYHVNLGKRLVKTPKVYFADTGLLCHLCGIKSAEQAASGPLAGALFESTVLMEFVKGYLHRGEEPRIYFWRTGSGAEVDVVLETERGLVAVEVKSTATPKVSMTSGLRSFRTMYGDRLAAMYVVHSGDVTLPLGEGCLAVPYGAL